MNHETFQSMCNERELSCAKLKDKNKKESFEATSLDKKLDKLNMSAFYEECERWFRHLQLMAPRYNKEQVYKAILTIALEPPDDTWSGRGNDFRRLMNDAKRDTLKECKEFVEFYC